MTKSRLASLWLLLALVPVAVLWCTLFKMGILDRAQEWSMDLRFRIRGEMPSPVKIVYVDMDAISLDPTEGKGIGGTPWNRHYYATVARALVEYGGAKAVGIDVLFSELGVSELTDRARMIEGNREFAKYLYYDPPVVVASSFTARLFRDVNGELAQRQLPIISEPMPPLEQIEGPEVPQFDVGLDAPFSPAGVGLIDDPYAGRLVALWAPSNVRTYYHLAVELLRRYWELPLFDDEGVRVLDDALEFVREDGEVIRRVPLAKGQLLEVNWFSKWQSDEFNPRHPFVDVYLSALRVESGNPEWEAVGQTFFNEGGFKDAIVLIGPVDEMLQDLATTPFDDSPVPKVGVHGNVLKTILAEKYIRRLADWQIYAIVVGLTLLIAGLSTWGGRRSAMGKLVALLLLAGYAGLCFVGFNQLQLVLPMIAPIGSSLSASLIAIAWQAVQEQKAKGRIKGMFGTYLAPTVVNSMIESGKDPELGGHDAEITPYFSDIQSFSSFSEVLPSAKLGELLNEYLTACTDIIQAEGGTLDKYIGDAVVAMFGAPVDLENHAYKACLTTQLVHARLDELRAKWISEGDKWPEMVHRMRTRIGLNTGPCMIGNMGSRTRFDYTMMGDNVNLAARMESGAKAWGAFTMVADSTRVAWEKHGGDRIVFRRLGRIIVQGRSSAVPIHEIVGLKENLTDRTFECLDLFEQGMVKYYARDWNGAADLFQRAERLEPLRPGVAPGVKNNPSLVYLGIVAEMADHPPGPDWDGVYIMGSK